MKIPQIIGLGLLIAGCFGLYFGYTASESLLEQASQSLTGRFSDETTLHLVGGVVGVVVGLALIIFGRK